MEVFVLSISESLKHGTAYNVTVYIIKEKLSHGLYHATWFHLMNKVHTF
jgi:hypothetical protein